MRKGGCKSKGSEFERRISGILDTWWDVPKKTFWRTVNSGGWKDPGDISPRLVRGVTQDIFPFVIECKFYKKVEFSEVLKSKNAILFKWWEQVTESQTQASTMVKDYSIIRLLIFKWNFNPIYVGFSLTDGTPSYQSHLKRLLEKTPYVIVSDSNEIFCITAFDVYYKGINKEIFKEI